LKSDLNENGIDTFVDEDSLEYGDSLKERLKEAINDSSHFIIILTINAIKSDWVKNELNEALSMVDQRMIAKVIPIKYRECEVPASLEKLLYADLSQEIVQVDKDRIAFLSDGYSNFLPRLIKTLHSSDKRLNMTEIKAMLSETKPTDSQLTKKSNEFVTQHKIIRFKDKNVILTYKAKIIKASPKLLGMPNIIPILLPTFYKAIYSSIKLGDKIRLTREGKTFVTAYFAGFRTKTDNGIAMPAEVRRFLNVEHGKTYDFSVDILKNIFYKL